MLTKMTVYLDNGDGGLCNAEDLVLISANSLFPSTIVLMRPTVAASIVWSSHAGMFKEMDRPRSLSPTVTRAKVKVSHSAVIKPGPRLASVGVS